MGSFPAIVPCDKPKEVVVEVYEVDDQTARNIDMLECGYKAAQVPVILPNGNIIEAGIYYKPVAQDFYKPVKTGDWVDFVLRNKNAPLKKSDIKED